MLTSISAATVDEGLRHAPRSSIGSSGGRHHPRVGGVHDPPVPRRTGIPTRDGMPAPICPTRDFFIWMRPIRPVLIVAMIGGAKSREMRTILIREDRVGVRTFPIPPRFRLDGACRPPLAPR